MYKKMVNFKSCGLLCFFSLVFFLFKTYISENLYLDIYTERDLQRTLSWLKGDIYWPGPEMSSGSSLPGPFFYFLLFPPLLFGEKIYTQILIWQMIWLATTYTVAFHFTSRICKHKESLFIFVMFLIACIGPSLFLSMTFAFNVRFSILFHLLAIIALYTWKDTGQSRYLYFLGLIVGFGVQVHALLLVHLLTVLIFVCFKKIKLKPVLCFLALTGLPCLPYFIMQSFHRLETSVYQLQHLNELKQGFLSESHLYNIDNITSFKPYLIGPVLFFFLLLIYKTYLKKAFPLPKSSINLFIITAIPICISLLVADRWWYLFSIPVLLIILFTKLCHDLMSPLIPEKRLNHLLFYGGLFILPLITHFQEGIFIFLGFTISLILFENSGFYRRKKPEKLKQDQYISSFWPKIIIPRNLLKICILLTMFLFFLFINKNHAINKIPQLIIPPLTFEDSLMNYYTKSKYHFTKPFLKQIALNTDWTAKMAIKRIYEVGVVQSTISLISYYSLAKEQIQKELKIPLTKVSGYFVISHLKQFTNHTQKDWKEYLSHSPYVSSFVREEIKTRKILLQTPELYNRYWLIPYKITEQSAFPEGFYNIGQPYSWEEPHWLKTCSSTRYFSGNNWDFYYCMILPGHFQRAGVFIKLFETDHKSFMSVDFFGALLGLKEEDANTDGYAYWSNIKVSLFCNNKRFTYTAPNIGYNPKSHYDLIAITQSLTSPLKLKYAISCKREDISKISLSFEHLKRNLHDYSITIPQQKEIIWKLIL